MHVLIVSQYFWPEEFRINDVAVGLTARGHRITVLTGQPNYPAGRFFEGHGPVRPVRETYEDIEVRRVPLVPRGRGGALRLALNYFSFAATASLCGPLRCRDRYDAILVFEPSPVTVGIPARVLAVTTGAPVLFWVQDLWPESLVATGAVRARWILRLVERMTRFIYRGCERVLVQSRAFIEPIKRLGVAAERIRYFPNTAEAVYQPVALCDDAPEHKLMPSGFRVLFAGNIGAAQDFETILAAAELLREHTDVHWIILGEGRLLPWVVEQVERRALAATVHLLGRYPVGDMPRFFAAADVLLVSLRRDPIFALTIPTKVQSYLACAKPVVAALDGEGARIIEEADAGLVAAPEDPAALAQAVLTMRSLPTERRTAMGESGRRYFEAHFERNRLLEQLERWMVELAHRPSSHEG